MQAQQPHPREAERLVQGHTACDKEEPSQQAFVQSSLCARPKGVARQSNFSALGEVGAKDQGVISYNCDSHLQVGKLRHRMCPHHHHRCSHSPAVHNGIARSSLSLGCGKSPSGLDRLCDSHSPLGLQSPEQLPQGSFNALPQASGQRLPCPGLPPSVLQMDSTLGECA